MYRIRPACPADADKMVALVRQSFDEKLLPAMLYGCQGVAGYITEQLLVPCNLADTRYIVAEEGDTIVGCVELRLQKDNIFLNYICVSPDSRTKGFGNELLLWSIDHVKMDHHMRMSLDVFVHNDNAKRWYEKLGFVTEHYTDWWSIPIEIDGECKDLGMISGYPHCVRSYEAFGFSQFGLVTQKSAYTVGWLGSTWFRVTDPALLCDRVALASLTKMGPQRTILGIFPKEMGTSLPVDAERLCSSSRMSILLGSLLTTLNERLRR